MTYYATVTLLVAWGFLGLAALFGGVIFWYAILAAYEQAREQVQSLADILAGAWEVVEPGLRLVSERARVLASALAFELRRP